jgi:hypothetical protein
MSDHAADLVLNAANASAPPAVITAMAAAEAEPENHRRRRHDDRCRVITASIAAITIPVAGWISDATGE